MSSYFQKTCSNWKKTTVPKSACILKKQVKNPIQDLSQCSVSLWLPRNLSKTTLSSRPRHKDKMWTVHDRSRLCVMEHSLNISQHGHWMFHLRWIKVGNPYKIQAVKTARLWLPLTMDYGDVSKLGIHMIPSQKISEHVWMELECSFIFIYPSKFISIGWFNSSPLPSLHAMLIVPDTMKRGQ